MLIEVVFYDRKFRFICPGCVHKLVAPPTGRRIIFQPDANAFRFMSEMVSLLNTISPAMSITPESHPGIYDQVKDYILEIYDLYTGRKPFSEIQIYTAFLQIMTLIGENFSMEFASSLPDVFSKEEEHFDKFLEMCDYISEHCTEGIKMEDAAEMTGFSKFYFGKLFKKFAGMPYYRYVNEQRMEKAIIYLMNPTYTITDVSIHCGFSSTSAFLRMFKQIRGCTPSEFRKMYKSTGNETASDVL